MTTQAKRLKQALNKWNVTKFGSPFNKSIYTPRKNGEFQTIVIHADFLTIGQIDGLTADLPHVEIYNDEVCKFSIIKY